MSADVVPARVRARVEAKHPPGPMRDAVLAGITGFYATGGWTPERKARVAHLLGPLTTRRPRRRPAA